jgi:hypothetical protein
MSDVEFGGSLWDRLTLRHHVRSADENKIVYLRLTDFDGNRPPLADVLQLPWVALNYLVHRRRLLTADPQPFMSFGAIRFLESVTWPGCRVLEVGGGNSTLWFLSRGANVTTIEHSNEWLSAIREKAGDTPSLTMHNLAGEDALRFLASLPDRSFDLALIDCGSAATSRPMALQAAKAKVSPGGWMVLDNSDFPAVKPATEHMAGYPARKFVGYGPRQPAVTQTTCWWLRPPRRT